MGLVLVAKWWRPVNWAKLARASVLMGIGLLLPLLPWAARNWRTLHHVQFLTPRYIQMPDDFAPIGFNAWTGTWLWRFRDVYLTLWRLNSEEIAIGSIPAEAFDSEQERARVAEMLDSYNYTLTLSREQDAEFGAIARERTANRPLRTYVKIPLLRSLTMWFTPRVELLPNSSPLRPVRSEWEDDRLDFLVTLGMALVNAAYIVLALAGAWMARGRPGVALLDRVHSGAHGVHREFYRDTGAALRPRMFSGGAGARRAGLRRAASAFLDRLGVNGQPVDLREALFDAIFKDGREVVDLRDRQVAIHRAVTRDENAALDAADVDLMAIHQLVIFGGQ